MEKVIKQLWEAHAELETIKIGVGNLESKDELKRAQGDIKACIRYLQGVQIGLDSIQQNVEAWNRVSFPSINRVEAE